MPVNGLNVANTLVIPLSAISLHGYTDALSRLLRVGVTVKANSLFPHRPVKTLDSPYGLGVTKGNTSLGYPQLRASLSDLPPKKGVQL